MPAPAAADFALAATPASVSLVPGGGGQQISVNAVAANGFSGMVNVAIAGLPNGVTAEPATLSLTPGAAQTLGARCPLSQVTPPRGFVVPEGWLTVRAEFDHEDFARFVVLGLGMRARVIEPAEFRQTIHDEALAVTGLSMQ